MIGPVLASGLFALFGLRMPFIVVAAVLLLLAPLALRLHIPGASNPLERAVRTLVKRPAIQACLAMGMAFYIAVGVFEAIWAVFMADLGASTLFIGITMSLFTLPMIAIAPWAGSLAQRRHVLKLVTLTMSTAVACMLVYGQLESIWWLCVPLGIHAMADAATLPATQLAVGYASGEGALAAGQGLFGAAGLAVAAVVSLTSGVIYEAAGASGLWSVSAIAMMVCILFALVRGKDHDWRRFR
jgi:predicted MFS family arabinose efflux permease